MKFKIASIGILMFSVLLSMTSAAEGREPPVAKLIQVTGAVEYSRNGSTWRPVRSTKYLFAGYQIKTGPQGGGKLVSQTTGKSQTLSADSQITITDSGITLNSGKISDPVMESATIFQGLSNKFAKAQRYTTVRRSASSGEKEHLCDSKVRTVRQIALSSAYPDLVWRNACPEISYRLVIDGTVHEISAHSNAEMIRFTVSGVSAGEHSYRVEVMDVDGIVYIPKKDSKFTWLNKKQESKIVSNLKKQGDDIFMIADLLESENLLVAAMDVYRAYFDDNLDDNDMRPLLVKSYNDLKLKNLKKNEARLYKASLEEDY